MKTKSRYVVGCPLIGSLDSIFFPCRVFWDTGYWPFFFFKAYWDICVFYFGIWDIQEFWDKGYWNLFWDTS